MVVLRFGYNVYLMDDESFTSERVISVTTSNNKSQPQRIAVWRQRQIKVRPVDLAKCLTWTKKTTKRTRGDPTLQLQQEERTTKENADNIQKETGSRRRNNNKNNNKTEKETIVEEHSKDKTEEETRVKEWIQKKKKKENK